MNTRSWQLAIAILIVSLEASFLPLCSSSAYANDLDKIYQDESHCLTLPEMRRRDQDMQISCLCRDAIVDARYVYFTYVDNAKDPNLTGVLLDLLANIHQQCGDSNGDSINAADVSMRKNWKWDGPEVIRTYPPDDVVKRIEPNKDGVRSVPFTIQLIYRDDKGRVIRTENYSSYYPDLRFK